MKNNENLKTLKDLEKSKHHSGFAYSSDLRSTAKEWIKVNSDDYDWDEIKKCPKCKSLMESNCEGYNFCHNCGRGACDIELWIKHFFNLEDE